MTYPALRALAAAGYCVDEWPRWQQGNCGIYAVALMQARPHLRFGEIADDGCVHFYAHDDHFAYDSAGRHALPYCGIGREPEEGGSYTQDSAPGWHGVPEDEGSPEEVEAGIRDALAHAQRNGILALIDTTAPLTLAG